MSTKSMRRSAPINEVGPDDYVRPGDSVGGLVRELYRSMTRSLQTRIQREGVTTGMWFVLRALWEEDGLTQREVAQRATINGPSMVIQLNAMERAGFVRRIPNKDDRRKINVYLTKQGRALQRKLWPMANEVNALALQDVGGETTEVLTQTLKRMLHNLETDRL